jgi:hypothetical protein
MTSHVILARADDGGGWRRSDLREGCWNDRPALGSLDSHAPDLAATLEEAWRLPDVTVSSFRKTRELTRITHPEDAGLAGRCDLTYILCPLGGSHPSHVWRALGFSAPDRPPLKGETFPVDALPELMRDYLADIGLRLANDAPGLFEEFWIRPAWTAEVIAPGAFPASEGGGGSAAGEAKAQGE